MKVLTIFIFITTMAVASMLVYEDVQETHFKQESKCP